MNDENLIHNSERTPSELREMTRNGGKKSGAARRKKKMLRECIEVLLEKKIDITDKNGKKTKMTGAEALTARLYQSAMKGDVRAFEVLRDTAGQKPVEKIMVADVSQDVIDDVEAMVYGEEDDTE